jgi:MULE transposase domain
MGSTGLNTSFFIGFTFLSGKTNKNYTWALNALIDVIQAKDISVPTVIVTDRELALINAIISIYPSSNYLLYE